MLSKNQLVRVRKTIESTYYGICNISELDKYLRHNKSVDYDYRVVIENQPCRLSYSSLSSTTSDGYNNTKKIGAKLFIAPELIIKPGSKIVITQSGRTTEFKQSGEPAVYDNHQEIVLVLFEDSV